MFTLLVLTVLYYCRFMLYPIFCFDNYLALTPILLLEETELIVPFCFFDHGHCVKYLFHFFHFPDGGAGAIQFLDARCQ